MTVMPMSQREIDEISDSFNDAWEEFFGQEVEYFRFLRDEVKKHDIYDEVVGDKVYDMDNPIKFHAIFKQEDDKETGGIYGRDNIPTYIVTFVTKVAVEQGLKKVDFRDILRLTDRFGEVTYYDIIGEMPKVQLVDNRIFTRLRVILTDV